MRLLVIEDEAKTAKFLKKGSGRSGLRRGRRFRTATGWAGAGQEASNLISIILDIMLPGLDGWEVLTGSAKDAGKNDAGSLSDCPRCCSRTGERV